MLGLCLGKTRAGKSHDYRFQKVFSKCFPSFSSSSSLESLEGVFVKTFSLWTVHLTVEIKLRFHISSASC